MQDDCYIISDLSWVAQTNLVPEHIVIDCYFKTEKTAIADLKAKKENITSQIKEFEEEHNTEDGYLRNLEKINKANVRVELKLITNELKTANTELKRDLNAKQKILK